MAQQPMSREAVVVGLYDLGEIGFIDPSTKDVPVTDPDYPEEAFIKLQSGRMSPYYYDGRDLTSFTRASSVPMDTQRQIRDFVVDSTSEVLDQFAYDHLVGIPLAMTCMSGLIAQKRGDSVLWMRDAVPEEDYGKHKPVQGHLGPAETAVALENVITTVNSALGAFTVLRQVGIETVGLVPFIDREESDAAQLAIAPKIVSVFGISEMIEIGYANGRVSEEEYGWAQQYRAKYPPAVQA